MYNKGDFHIHSNYSDGMYSPHKVVMIAKKKEVDIISLTDHNNTSGIDEAIIYGNELGVKIIPGVELSTRYNSTRVHILGYFKDDSYKNELLVEVLRNVKTHKITAIEHLLGNHVNFYAKKDRLHVKTGIEILKFFGATVVLAHPVLLNRSDFIDIIKLDFDGLEARYFSNKSEDTEYFLKVAKDKNLLYTAGSDFHSCSKFYRTHGIIGDVYLNKQEISNFLINGNLIHV